jgi:hypothetical protein
MPSKVPTVFAGVTYPTRAKAAAVLAPLVPCSTHSAKHMLRACAGDGDVALERLRAARAAVSDRAAALAALARETGWTEDALRKTQSRDGLSLPELAEWARTHSNRRVVVGGKSYPNKTAYFAVLHRRYGIGQTTLKKMMKDGASFEDLAVRALARVKQKDPDHYRRLHYGAVEAYGWRWRSCNAFCIYYFGYCSVAMPIRRTMDEARVPMSLGKAALERILRLFDIGELCADCRWPPEREAVLPASCLPLNAREDRLPDDLNMAAFHAGIRRSHMRDRALGEAARAQALSPATGIDQPPGAPP